MEGAVVFVPPKIPSHSNDFVGVLGLKNYVTTQNSCWKFHLLTSTQPGPFAKKHVMLWPLSRPWVTRRVGSSEFPWPFPFEEALQKPRRNIGGSPGKTKGCHLGETLVEGNCRKVCQVLKLLYGLANETLTRIMNWHPVTEPFGSMWHRLRRSR